MLHELEANRVQQTLEYIKVLGQFSNAIQNSSPLPKEYVEKNTHTHTGSYLQMGLVS